MRQRSQAKDIEVKAGYDQVPKEVASCKGLDEASGTSITPNSFLPSHVLDLVIGEHDPNSKAVNEAALHHGHNVGIPVKSPLSRELGVVLWG